MLRPPHECFGQSWSRSWAHQTEPVWSRGCSDREQLHHCKGGGSCCSWGSLESTLHPKELSQETFRSLVSGIWSLTLS